jgi:hypothetical protein
MTLLGAVARPRFLISVWPWRAIAYTATTAVASGLLWLVLAGPLLPLALAVEALAARRTGYLLVAAGLGLVGVGALALAGPRLAVAVAGAERWRLRLAGEVATPARRRSGLYTDPATWRAVAYLLLLGVVGPLCPPCCTWRPGSAAPTPRWPGCCCARSPTRPPPNWSRWPGRGPGWPTRSTPSGSASSATCTTSPSNGW